VVRFLAGARTTSRSDPRTTQSEIQWAQGALSTRIKLRRVILPYRQRKSWSFSFTPSIRPERVVIRHRDKLAYSRFNLQTCIHLPTINKC